MCIALLSTAHPQYPLIVLSNRDEFLARPTARSDWWGQPHEHVLAGRDLEREERGTWLGVTNDGRFAVLTNFREEGSEVSKGKSRGGIVNAWLQPPAGTAPSIESFADNMIDNFGVQDVGGFSLVYGRLRAEMGKGLAVISNRTRTSTELPRICSGKDETHGLSNSHFGDLSWPKVVHGEMLLKQAINSDVSRGKDQARLIDSLFDILSVDTLPRKVEGEDQVTYLRQLRHSIFIPPFGGQADDHRSADTISDSTVGDTTKVSPSITGHNVYGTQKQTVILVDRFGRVTWIERTLYDRQNRRLDEESRDAHFAFDISEWSD